MTEVPIKSQLHMMGEMIAPKSQLKASSGNIHQVLGLSVCLGLCVPLVSLHLSFLGGLFPSVHAGSSPLMSNEEKRETRTLLIGNVTPGCPPHAVLVLE